jgi:hypothetical protein
MTLMMLSSEFQYAFSISLYFFTFISLLYSQITKREGERKKNKQNKNLKDTPKHWCWYHQYHKKKHLDKTNPTASKKVTNYDWSESRELPKTQVSFTTFGWLIWLALSNVGNLNWYHWICLIEIFPTILVMLLLEFWSVSKIFFLFFFSHFSLLRIMSNYFTN